jgi:inner membrane protease ATP23
MRWWLTYIRILAGRVTPEGAEHCREDWRRMTEARDCTRCEAHRDYLFAYSPTIRFLRDKVAALNGTLDETNVLCRRCPARVAEDGRVVRQAGGFSPDHGILLCANEMRDRGHLEDTMAHEMVHAWDHLRWKMDWNGGHGLRHAACTEVSFWWWWWWFWGGSRDSIADFGGTDPRIDAQWGVSVGPGDHGEEELEADAAVPELRTRQGHPVRHGAGDVSGQRARHQCGQRGVGVVLCR